MFNRIKNRRGFTGGFLCGLALAAVLYAVCHFALDKEQEIWRYIHRNAIDAADDRTVEEGKYRGMLSALGDPYAAYYSEEEAQEMMQTTRGTYTGIGIVFLTDEDGSITVQEVFEGSPAQRAGILPGDEVVRINGIAPPELKISDLAAGIADGSIEEVQIAVQREGVPDLIEAVLHPEEIDLRSVYYEMQDGDIGYIYISNFREATGTQFASAYQDLLGQGMKGLIVDLRDDGGGLVTSSVEALQSFMPEGLLVYTVEKDGTRKDYKSECKEPISIPLVVLVNENTASASEIFAGAVQDTGVGTIVGTTTYGKGIVQTFFTLRDDSMIRFTTANYYTPSGTNLNGTGITPDVVVEAGEDAQEDPQLAKARELLG